MKKALVVASVGGFIDFEKDDIKRLESLGLEVHIACAEKGWEKYLKGIKNRIIDIPFSRSPFSKSNVKAYKQLKKLINDEKYSLIHCHTPIAGMITRLVAKKARKKGCKVVYTAHGFHFYQGAPLINWLLYYPVEWGCSWLTDVLITINIEDYDLARKKMHAKKIEYVPGVGIDIESIKRKEIDKGKIRDALGLKVYHKMLLSVGEINANKNHKIIIEAIAKIGDKNLQYYIAGVGILQEDLQEMAKRLGVGDQIHFLGYRNDVLELDKAADLFCFPSHREGLSVALMEAIACGTKVICSNIRGNRDLAIGNGNVVLFDQRDIDDCADKIKSTINMNRNKNSRIDDFSKHNVKSMMLSLYKEVMKR